MAALTQPSADRAPGAISAAISNAVVHLLSEHTGHGPTKARTYITEDLITVVLRDSLTKGERALASGGETHLVLANRTAYQNALRGPLTDAVERISGRRVRAFLSANHLEPDYAVESFILEPAGATEHSLARVE